MEQPSKSDRYKSLLVDYIIILIITLFIMSSPSYPIKFIAIFIPLVYFPILHILWSRSIGDIVFNLKVVDQQGKKIGFRPALNRFIRAFKYYIFSLLLCNLLFLISIMISGTLKEVSLDYEGESKTYLVKAK